MGKDGVFFVNFFYADVEDIRPVSREKFYLFIKENEKSISVVQNYFVNTPFYERVREHIYSFAKLVYFLPASADHHHSEVFGLLVHTFETVLQLVIRKFAKQEVPKNVLYAQFLCDLYHDVGKIFAFEVSKEFFFEKEIKRVVWNPFQESLFDFCKDVENLLVVRKPLSFQAVNNASLVVLFRFLSLDEIFFLGFDELLKISSTVLQLKMFDYYKDVVASDKISISEDISDRFMPTEAVSRFVDVFHSEIVAGSFVVNQKATSNKLSLFLVNGFLYVPVPQVYNHLIKSTDKTLLHISAFEKQAVSEGFLFETQKEKASRFSCTFRLTTSYDTDVLSLICWKISVEALQNYNLIYDVQGLLPSFPVEIEAKEEPYISLLRSEQGKVEDVETKQVVKKKELDSEKSGKEKSLEIEKARHEIADVVKEKVATVNVDKVQLEFLKKLSQRKGGGK